jgi:hypothetical protein
MNRQAPAGYRQVMARAGRGRKTEETAEETARRFREVISTIPEEDRRFLLEALTADPATRAHLIGNLRESGLAPATTELLVDAAADPALSAWLVGLLREAQAPPGW